MLNKKYIVYGKFWMYLFSEWKICCILYIFYLILIKEEIGFGFLLMIDFFYFLIFEGVMVRGFVVY